MLTSNAIIFGAATLLASGGMTTTALPQLECSDTWSIAGYKTLSLGRDVDCDGSCYTESGWCDEIQGVLNGKIFEGVYDIDCNADAYAAVLGLKTEGYDEPHHNAVAITEAFNSIDGVSGIRAPGGSDPLTFFVAEDDCAATVAALNSLMPTLQQQTCADNGGTFVPAGPVDAYPQVLDSCNCDAADGVGSLCQYPNAAISCNGAGDVDEIFGTCKCHDSHAAGGPTCSEFSDAVTCNGGGALDTDYDSQVSAPVSCTCEEGKVGAHCCDEGLAGTTCEISAASLGCENGGTPNDNGMCECPADGSDFGPTCSEYTSAEACGDAEIKILATTDHDTGLFSYQCDCWSGPADGWGESECALGKCCQIEQDDGSYKEIGSRAKANGDGGGDSAAITQVAAHAAAIGATVAALMLV